MDITAIVAILLALRGNYILATFSLFFLFLASVPTKSILGSITRNPVLMRFGVYCYSIYLFQFPLLNILDPFKNILFQKLGVVNSIVEVRLIIYFPLIMLISFGLAFLSFNLIEKPSVNFGKKVIPKINAALDLLSK